MPVTYGRVGAKLASPSVRESLIVSVRQISVFLLRLLRDQLLWLRSYAGAVGFCSGMSLLMGISACAPLGRAASSGLQPLSERESTDIVSSLFESGSIVDMPDGAQDFFERLRDLGCATPQHVEGFDDEVAGVTIVSTQVDCDALAAQPLRFGLLRDSAGRLQLVSADLGLRESAGVHDDILSWSERNGVHSGYAWNHGHRVLAGVVDVDAPPSDHCASTWIATAIMTDHPARCSAFGTERFAALHHDYDAFSRFQWNERVDTLYSLLQEEGQATASAHTLAAAQLDLYRTSIYRAAERSSVGGGVVAKQIDIIAGDDVPLIVSTLDWDNTAIPADVLLDAQAVGSRGNAFALRVDQMPRPVQSNESSSAYAVVPDPRHPFLAEHSPWIGHDFSSDTAPFQVVQSDAFGNETICTFDPMSRVIYGQIPATCSSEVAAGITNTYPPRGDVGTDNDELNRAIGELVRRLLELLRQGLEKELFEALVREWIREFGRLRKWYGCDLMALVSLMMDHLSHAQLDFDETGNLRFRAPSLVVCVNEAEEIMAWPPLLPLTAGIKAIGVEHIGQLNSVLFFSEKTRTTTGTLLHQVVRPRELVRSDPIEFRANYEDTLLWALYPNVFPTLQTRLVVIGDDGPL